MEELNKQECVYQSFSFKNEIKQYSYAGDKFMHHKAGMNMEESLDFAWEMIGDEQAFMPELVRKIQELLGKGNFIYDYWESGDDDFSLYWWIKNEVYHEKMKLVKEWVKYEEWEDYVYFHIKEIKF